MQRTIRTIFLLSATLLIFFSCKRIEKGAKTVTADYIEYSVIYLENMAGDIPTAMLPDVMKTFYSNRHVKTSIKGFFGQFSLVQIADLRQNRVTTMLNFFGNKVCYTGDKGEIPAGIVSLEDPQLKVTSDTMSVCGMVAKRAEVVSGEEMYDIYYIEEIGIKSPNITTPYHFIDYVLSDFRVQLSILKMQLIMSHHEKITVQSSIFDIPEDYQQVSRETMESIINSLFTKG
ncbi:MAG: hypothetical protein K9G38_06260 [Bacteroidales bacterium]|nr:hypothetical protein [Bacteroidales bacterium]